MKYLLSILFTCILQTVPAQKLAILGGTTFKIPGEKIIEYDELGLYATHTRWIEVYLFLSADSIIITELQAKQKTDAFYESVYMYTSGKVTCNTESISIQDHDLIKKPEHMKKVIIRCIYGQMNAWKTNDKGGRDSLGNVPTDQFRIIVKDEEQAKIIIEKLKAK